MEWHFIYIAIDPDWHIVLYTYVNLQSGGCTYYLHISRKSSSFNTEVCHMYKYKFLDLTKYPSMINWLHLWDNINIIKQLTDKFIYHIIQDNRVSQTHKFQTWVQFSFHFICLGRLYTSYRENWIHKTISLSYV